MNGPPSSPPTAADRPHDLATAARPRCRRPAGPNPTQTERVEADAAHRRTFVTVFPSEQVDTTSFYKNVLRRGPGGGPAYRRADPRLPHPMVPAYPLQRVLPDPSFGQ